MQINMSRIPLLTLHGAQMTETYRHLLRIC